MYDIRPLGPGDLDLICRQRREMFLDAGRAPAVLEEMAAPYRAWLAPKLADGSYFGWIVEFEGRPVAGLGMSVIDWGPHPNHPTQDRRGYIQNVVVDAAHRGRGLSSRLMQLAEDEGRARGLDFLTLHATDKGRLVYDKRGWTAGKEMVLSLR